MSDATLIDVIALCELRAFHDLTKVPNWRSLITRVVDGKKVWLYALFTPPYQISGSFGTFFDLLVASRVAVDLVETLPYLNQVDSRTRSDIRSRHFIAE